MFRVVLKVLSRLFNMVSPVAIHFSKESGCSLSCPLSQNIYKLPPCNWRCSKIWPESHLHMNLLVRRRLGMCLCNSDDCHGHSLQLAEFLYGKIHCEPAEQSRMQPRGPCANHCGFPKSETQKPRLGGYLFS